MSIRPIAKNEKKTKIKSFGVTSSPFFSVMTAYILLDTNLNIKEYVSANVMPVINFELNTVVGLESVADKINANIKSKNTLNVLSEVNVLVALLHVILLFNMIAMTIGLMPYNKIISDSNWESEIHAAKKRNIVSTARLEECRRMICKSMCIYIPIIQRGYCRACQS